MKKFIKSENMIGIKSQNLILPDLVHIALFDFCNYLQEVVSYNKFK